MTISPTALEEAAKAMHGAEPWSSFWSTDDARLLATAAITAYLAQTKREGSEMTPAATADLLRFVIDHYANQDMNHADFRVYAYQIAQRIVEPTDASN